jgi:MoaA/NifB/PqqE/SkfB family radical SAM enzyme
MLAPPYALQVEITSACNLSCRMCPLTLGATPSSRQPAHMREATWREVVAAAKQIGSVNLTGYGENTTHPRFIGMLGELDRDGVSTSFSTNGIGMIDKVVDALAALRHLYSVNVSIDSPEPEIYRQVRGGDVTRALDGLTRLSRALRPKTLVTVSAVLMVSNVESLRVFPELLAEIGVDAFVLQALHDRSSELAEWDLRDADLLATVAALQTRCRELGVPVRVDAGGLSALAPPPTTNTDIAFSKDWTRQCLSPWSYPFIDRDGYVFPCCIADDTAIMGKLGQAPLHEIWSGQAFRQFRTDLVGGVNMPNVCRVCTAIKALGPHPMRFAAAIDWRRSMIRGTDGLRLVVRNTGGAPWNGQQRLAIGRVGDVVSTLWLPSWVSKDRIVYMDSREVMPNGETTLSFDIAMPRDGVREDFALVVDGRSWLDGTTFSLPVFNWTRTLWRQVSLFPSHLTRSALRRTRLNLWRAVQRLPRVHDRTQGRR